MKRLLYLLTTLAVFAAHDYTEIDNLPDELWIGSGQMEQKNGTVTKGLSSNVWACRLDDAVTEGIVFTFAPLPHWTSGTVDVYLYWLNHDAAAANDIRVQIQYLEIDAGTDGADTSHTNVTETFAISGTQYLISEHQHNTNIALDGTGQLVNVIVNRLGADGADTFTGVAALIGAKIVYTAT